MKWLKYFLFTIFLSYASIWGPYYVSLFGNLRVLGSIDSISEPCADLSEVSSECKIQYIMPAKLVASLPASSSLGLGVLIHALEIGCAKKGGFDLRLTIGDKRNAGKTIDALSTYQTLSLTQLQCEGDVVVKVWSPKQYRRFGLIDGLMVGGDPLYVLRVKKITEFFRDHFLILITVIFLVISIFNSVLYSITRRKDQKSPVETYQWAWIGYMLFFSGLLNTFFPFIGGAYEITRVSNFFSLLARIGPGFYAIRSGRSKAFFSGANFALKKIKFSWLTPLIVSLFLLEASPYFAKSLGPAYMVGGILFVVASFVCRDTFLFFWGVCSIVDGLKVLMIPGLPTPYMMMCLAMFSVLDSFLAKVRSGSRILDSLRWARETVHSLNSADGLLKVIREFADRFSIGQISMIVPQADGNCEIFIERNVGKKWTSEKILLNKMPEIFSHVLTTREALWNVEEGSLMASNIRKGEEKKFKYRGNYFSVVPILYNSMPIAGLAFTDFPNKVATDEAKLTEITSVADLLLPFFAKFISSKMVVEKSEWSDTCSALIHEIKKIEARNIIDDQEFIQAVASLVSEKMNYGTFISYLDQSTRRLIVKGVAGMEAGIEKMYRESEFYAVSHNERGPIPLSVNRRRPALVSDLSWIRPVLHPNTLAVFDVSGIKSCASVPIFEGVPGSEESIWGILWLESKEVGAFSHKNERGLIEVCGAIQEIFHNRNAQKKHKITTELLSGFVPENILTKLVKGESVRVNEQGFLLMADLRDSTKLSRKIGADDWVAFVSTLLGPAQKVAEKYGFEIQAAIWDALYFTKSDAHSFSEADLISFSDELSQLFEAGMCKKFGDPMSEQPYHSRARFCLVHGDISRDVRSSVTSSWTIVGSSMAAISKLEQACKSHTGWIFCGDSVPFVEQAVNWDRIGSSAKGTGESIHRYRDMFLPDKGKFDQYVAELGEIGKSDLKLAS